MPQAQLIVYAAGFLAILIALWGIHHHGDRTGYERATAEMAKQVAKANESVRVAEIKSREAIEGVDRAYQVQLEDLDTRYRDATERLGSIRVSKCPTGGIALSRSAKPAALNHGPAKADAVPGDITRAIEQLVRDADEQTQRLIACQAYATTVSRF